MKNLNIKIEINDDEIHVIIEGNDYYYDMPITEAEAVIRSVFKYYGYEADYYLEGCDF